jgi:hypothetical protein
VTPKLKPEDLRAYRDRAWALAREAKKQYWAEDARTGGPEAGLRVSEGLWLHARTVDPSWPSDVERDADLEHHLRLAARIARVSHVFSGR